VSDIDYEVPVVRRVQNGHGSHIEPEFDRDAGELNHLRWHAAVAELDAGMAPGSLRILNSHGTINGVYVVGEYNYRCKNASGTLGTFRQAWGWINGFRQGAEVMSRLEAQR